MRKLKPAELAERGLSPKSERYLTDDNKLISKRQYQKLQRGGLTYNTWKKAVEEGKVVSHKKRGATAFTAKKKNKRGHTIYEYKASNIKDVITILKRHKRRRAQIITEIEAGQFKSAKYDNIKVASQYVTIVPGTFAQFVTPQKIFTGLTKYLDADALEDEENRSEPRQYTIIITKRK